eukprot:5880442-Pyramimonas_sp.AAC.1
MPPWAPVRADVTATSALLSMSSRTVTMRDGIPYLPPSPPELRAAFGAGRTGSASYLLRFINK